MPEKMRTENPGQKLQIRPENLSLLVPGGRLFTSLMLEKLRPKNPSKRLQIPPENPTASNCRNDRKIRWQQTEEWLWKGGPKRIKRYRPKAFWPSLPTGVTHTTLSSAVQALTHVTLPVPSVSFSTLESSTRYIVHMTSLRIGLLTPPLLSVQCLYSDFMVYDTVNTR